MLKSVAHGNGVTVTHGLDPHGMRRPGSIATSGVTGTPGNWNSGAYAYDGAGNITRVGEEWYTYDLVSRLAANSYPMPEGECPTSLQSLAYTYDPLGNMTSWTYNCSGTHTYSVDPSTNRLTTQTYDPSGNALTTVGEANAETLAYYPFNDLRSAVGTGLNRLYGYTADGERLVDYDAQPNPPAGPFTITLRDLTGKVLRSFQVTTGQPGTWTEKEDWIYRDGQLLATVDTTVQGGVARHVHLDHLGTPRLITSASGVGLETHTYLPFGLEVTDLGPLFERMKFTGHERDLASGLDYMHARYYSPYANRFLSVDPGKADAGVPQSWNRYAYVLGNPLKYTDPEGEVVCLGGLTADQQDQLLTDLNQYTGNSYGVDKNGNLILVSVGDNSSRTATGFLGGLIGAEAVFGVTATEGRNRWNDETGNVELNFNSFAGADYGRVNPASFSLGSTLVHELFHGATGAQDEARPGVYTTGFDWTGPVVNFVNVVRAERGLPLRGAYNAEPTVFRGREKLAFQMVDPKRPEKEFYVIRKIYGK
jgi:RHS repeat-associated protein